MVKNKFLFVIFLFVIIIYSIVLIVFFDIQINESFGYIDEQRKIIALASNYNAELINAYKTIRVLQNELGNYHDDSISPKIARRLSYDLRFIKSQQVLFKYMILKDNIKGYTAISVSIFSILLLLSLVILLYLILRELVNPIYQIIRALEEYLNNKRIIKVKLRGSTRIKRILNQFNIILEKIQIERIDEKLKNTIQNWQMIARMIVHEIKNQISPIALTIDTLTYYSENDDSEMIGELNKIKENIYFIEKIITNLRDIANLPEPKCDRIEIVDLTKEIIDKNKFPRDEILLCNTELNFAIYSDLFFLELILINLIKNSFQACKTKKPQILIEFIQENNYIVTIKDNGVGIKEEDLEKIFKPGFSTKKKGSGYGLFIVKELCNILDIEISVTSKINHGTKFRLEFHHV